MSELDRKDFLKLTITVVTTACFSQACGDEEPTPGGTGGVSGAAPTGGMAGQATGGTATGGTATGGTATGGTATGGTATGGTATGGTATGGAGGAGAGGGGAGGAGSGSGGAGAGGAAGGGAGGMAGGGRGGMSGGGGAAGGGGRAGGGAGGAAGGGGGMCMAGNFGIMQTMTTGTDMHDHLPLPAMGMNSTQTIVAAVNSGMAVSIMLPMDGNHSHTLALTAGEVQMLASGMTVSKASTGGGHVHTYSIECAA